MEYTWEVVPWDNKRGFNIFSDRGLVATVPLMQGRSHTMQEVIANANLIASAPDMYEALKNLVERIDEGLALGEELDIAPARQALSKADNVLS